MPWGRLAFDIEVRKKWFYDLGYMYQSPMEIMEFAEVLLS